MFSSEAQVRVARASLFAAQAIARDIIAACRDHEVDEVCGFTTIAPDVGNKRERNPHENNFTLIQFVAWFRHSTI